MLKLLKLSTYGLKNLENMVTLEFCNSTVKSGIKNVNNIKGIYGYNGAGKSAIICAIDLYNKIVTSDSFINERHTIEELDNLINYKKREFFISVIFESSSKNIIEHVMKIKKDNLLNKYIIFYEEIKLHKGRTLNEKEETIFLKTEDSIKSKINLEGISQNMNNLNYNSFIHEFVINYLKNSNSIVENKKKNNLDEALNIIANIYMFSVITFVHLFNSDNYFYDYTKISKILNALLDNKTLNKETENYNKELMVLFQKQQYKVVVKKTDIEEFKNKTKKLEQFLKLFKPELREIELEMIEDKENVNIRRVFVYDDYKVDLEYESSGIKQLVNLFPYLNICANGGIVFIDEIDTFLNTVYLEKLVSFFMEYGKGQLIYTAHNIEPMTVLKNQLKAITILGVDNQIETFTKVGNYDPKRQYKKGYFPNLPMNVENFDFLSIFFEENK